MDHTKGRILIMTAVSAEKDAVLRDLHHHPEKIEVQLAGVGPIAAAANTAKFLATKEYDLVISAGIGGGFSGKAEVGSLVIADAIIAADLGVETPEGFRFLEALNLGSSQVSVDPSLVNPVVEALSRASLPVNRGPILTVSTTTGSAERAEEMVRRVPGAAAEGMEGYGVAYTAHTFGVPVLEIRTISNPVGPRDRKAWRIPEALELLSKTFSVLEEFL